MNKFDFSKRPVANHPLTGVYGKKIPAKDGFFCSSKDPEVIHLNKVAFQMMIETMEKLGFK